MPRAVDEVFGSLTLVTLFSLSLFSVYRRTLFSPVSVVTLSMHAEVCLFYVL